MIAALLTGAGFAFAATVQPGPFLAFLLARVAARGWRSSLPAAFAPLLSDGPIALLALVLLQRLPPGVERLLRGAGGLLLLALAVVALRSLRKPAAAAPAEEKASPPRTLLEAAVVNALGPGPYLGWSLVMGPATLRAWAEAPANAVVLVGSFYATMVVTLLLIIRAFGTAGLLSERKRRTLALASVVVLGLLGLWQLAGAVAG